MISVWEVKALALYSVLRGGKKKDPTLEKALSRYKTTISKLKASPLQGDRTTAYELAHAWEVMRLQTALEYLEESLS